MCLSIPGQVVSIHANRAIVDIEGVKTEASLDLLTDIAPGDFVLVHTGYAIQKYSVEEAEKTLELIREIARDANG